MTIYNITINTNSKQIKEIVDKINQVVGLENYGMETETE